VVQSELHAMGPPFFFPNAGSVAGTFSFR
jgi:hypothetical protein